MTARLLTNQVMPYPWGSTRTIQQLLGRPVDGSPIAELWMGAHAGAPSTLDVDGVVRTLADVIAADPPAMLGGATVQRFDGHLPFLLKMLAVDNPLSLQAHPTVRQARAGYAAENDAGVPLDAPDRNYKDANHKPEMVCALSRFDGLAGFRPVTATAGFLEALDPVDDEQSALAGLRRRLVAEGGLRDVVTWLLSAERGVVDDLLAQLLPGARRLAAQDGHWAAEAAWLVRLAGVYPGDRGLVIAGLLNLVSLEPGQALFLSAGQLHAYLHGTAIEIMASSDNVLRGGFTGKHVDVLELARVLDFTCEPAQILTAVAGAGGIRWYPDVVADFRLGVVDGAAEASSPAGRARVVFCTVGTAEVGGPRLALRAGESAFVPAVDDCPVSVGPGGQVFIATTGGAG